MATKKTGVKKVRPPLAWPSMDEPFVIPDALKWDDQEWVALQVFRSDSDEMTTWMMQFKDLVPSDSGLKELGILSAELMAYRLSEIVAKAWCESEWNKHAAAKEERLRVTMMNVEDVYTVNLPSGRTVKVGWINMGGSASEEKSRHAINWIDKGLRTMFPSLPAYMSESSQSFGVHEEQALSHMIDAVLAFKEAKAIGESVKVEEYKATKKSSAVKKSL